MAATGVAQRGRMVGPMSKGMKMILENRGWFQLRSAPAVSEKEWIPWIHRRGMPVPDVSSCVPDVSSRVPGVSIRRPISDNRQTRAPQLRRPTGDQTLGVAQPIALEENPCRSAEVLRNAILYIL